VAVVLCTNEAEEASACIRSLLQVDYPNFKIFLVDNASTDGSAEKLGKRFPDIRVICRATNEGYSAGNNTGIRAALEAGADHVLISNSDIVADSNFLKPLVQILEQQADVGLVAGTARYSSHPEQIYYAAGKFSRLFCSGMNTTRRSGKLAEGERDVDVNFVNGAMFLTRRSVFESLGLLDESFFLYFDDLEYSRRYGSRYRMVYTPKSVVYHKSGGGKGWRRYTTNYLYYHTRNRFWVFRNEPLYYRIYVAIFATMNVLAKSAVLSGNFVADRERTLAQVQALWRGYRDGLLREAQT
jgi:GT2 family glycosyltransferase